MTSLVEVACHIPEQSESLAEAGARLGMSRFEQRMFEKFLGLREIRVASDRSYADRIVDATVKLKGLRGNENRIVYLIAARSFHAVATPSEAPVHEAADRVGLRRAITFSVTEHACSSGLLALWTAGWLLRDEDPDAMALIVTGEPTPLEGFHLPATIIGDSTAACLVRAGEGHDRLLSYAFRMGSGIDEILKLVVSRSPDSADVVHGYSSTASVDEYAKDYTENVIAVIREALADAGIALDQVSLILPPNINRISLIRICRQLDYPAESVMLDNIAVTGHCYTADSFINYTEALRQGLLRSGEYYVMVSVGMGGGFAAMVFQH